MAKTLTIASGLKLPIDIAGQTIGLVGIRGSGKTNTAGVIAEELLDHNQPIVVIDPTDAWWGLRSGYPVFIFGGPHGDITLNETDGKLIAEFLVTEQVPVILSLRHLRKGAQRRFVTDFCEELYHLKGKDKYRSPLTVFIDEAPLFVPQRVMGDIARTVGAVEDLIARGRNSGFGVVLISQRPATINKDVLTQADTIIAHRLTSPQDRKALGEWIEENATVEKHKEILSSLAGMQNGKAWIWSPRLDIMQQTQIRLRNTFDSSASPKIGQKVTTPKKLQDIDLGKLKDKLAAAVESKKANDPKVLQGRIAELEKQLKHTKPLVESKALFDTAVIDKAVKLALSTAQKENREIALKLQKAFGKLQQWKTNTNDIIQAVLDALGVFNRLNANIGVNGGDLLKIESLKANTNKETERQSEKPSHASGAVRVPVAQGNTRTAETGDGQVLHRCPKTLLTVLAQRSGESTNKNQLSILSGYTIKSSGFQNAISKLRTLGYAVGGPDDLRITDDGLLAVGDYEPLPVGVELQQHWYRQLHQCPRSILQYLCSLDGGTATKEEISAATSYSIDSSGFQNAISKLRTLGLIEGKAEMKASDSLFD